VLLPSLQSAVSISFLSYYVVCICREHGIFIKTVTSALVRYRMSPSYRSRINRYVQYSTTYSYRINRLVKAPESIKAENEMSVG
jgi:hypothetical protein